MMLILQRNTNPGIADQKLNLVFFDADFQDDFPASRCEFDRIVHQVAEGLCQAVGVCLDNWQIIWAESLPR